MCVMTYNRKTADEYVLLTNYGYGWDEEVTEDTLSELTTRAGVSAEYRRAHFDQKTANADQGE